MTQCRKSMCPVSTYRLQMHKGFTFADAAAIAPYLYGSSASRTSYSSPYLQAAHQTACTAMMSWTISG